MKKHVIFLTFFLLNGCTISISESNFISQSDSIKHYTPQFLQSLERITAQHKVKELKMSVDGGNVELRGLHLDFSGTNNTILFIPGNGMTLESSATQKALLHLAEYNFDIVVFDRRGLGASNGKATISNLVEDAKMSFDYVQNQLHADKVLVHGFSLGSFLAAQVASVKPIDGLVMEGSATNVQEWIDEAIPWYKKIIVDVQVDDVFYSVDNKQVLRGVYKGPLLVIGGGEDKQTPVSLSHALYKSSNSENKQIVISEEADHYQMFDNESVRRVYANFVASL
ncbi:alpha/beta hydrolase [Pseudoalteromonas umbrosa]|uniref:alpha/beta hydrolase n=1 Tax=Pseudoalteromonas umbrosa TaxID=3048489 RepID=UPI0024C42143|nr:alpha/beta hydrolase [Pseudoalteromonas sp. B95]MDK1287968.1 alpha/beta hydrolase [Pseudoalteromonas sp. B95]